MYEEWRLSQGFSMRALEGQGHHAISYFFLLALYFTF